VIARLSGLRLNWLCCNPYAPHQGTHSRCPASNRELSAPSNGARWQLLLINLLGLPCCMARLRLAAYRQSAHASKLLRS